MQIEPFTPCRKCHKSDVKGHLTIVVNGEKTYTPCTCYISWKKREKLKIALEKANLPNISLTFDDYAGKTITIPYKLNTFLDNTEKQLPNLDKKYKDLSFYWHGTNGTQKTTIAYILGKELLIRKYSVFYVPTMMEMLKKLNSVDFNPTDDDLKYVTKLETSDFLIIDECFSNKNNYGITDYKLELLRMFLKNRIEIDQKSIVFISNYPISEISKQGYGVAIQSLISRSVLPYATDIEFTDVYNQVQNDFDPNTLWE